jgi:serine/threonine protein kinase
MQTIERAETTNCIIESALDLPSWERETFVASRCDGNRALHAEALRLLALSDEAHGFLERASIQSEIAPGARLGHLRIVRQLGSGGMGSIFLAEDDEYGLVTVKIIHPELRDRAAAARLRTELTIARAVQHPNLCPVFDLVNLNEEQENSITALTMKYLPGETLAERLSRAPMQPQEAFEIARGIAAGLDALHARGIVHRDLKPHNIMLSTEGGVTTPVIIDFGLASRSHGFHDGAAADEIDAAISGSPDYMAPEQFWTGMVTQAADIYAFGLMLFEMLSGSRPFPAEGLLAAAIRRNTEDAPRLRAVAADALPAWEIGLARALSRDPAERPVSACAMLDQMQESVDPVPPACRRCRHRRRLKRS